MRHAKTPSRKHAVAPILAVAFLTVPGAFAVFRTADATASATPARVLEDASRAGRGSPEATRTWERSAPRREYLGEPVEVVDIHMHTGSFESLGPLGQRFILATLPDFIPAFLKRFTLSNLAKLMLDPYGAFIGIQGECTKAGISRCGLMAVYAPETWGVTENERIIAALDDERNGKEGSSRFFGMASVDVSRWDWEEARQLAALRAALSHPGMKGIKLAFIHNDVPLDDRRFDSIYAVAREFHVPVYHHVGSSPLRAAASVGNDDARRHYVRSYDPNALEAAIKAWPDVSFVLGHMGFDFNKEGFDFSEDVYRIAKQNPNVRLEISAFGRASYDADGKFMDAALRNLRDRGLVERALYGSDGPVNPGATKKYLDSTLESMLRVGYTHAEASLVLSGNARELYRLDPSR